MQNACLARLTTFPWECKRAAKVIVGVACSMRCQRRQALRYLALHLVQFPKNVHHSPWLMGALSTSSYL